MAKTKVAGNPEHDSTLPKTPIKLGKETYYLCYNFRALSLAESKLRNVGIKCNILSSLDLTDLDATKLGAVLFAGLLAHKPNITFDEVLSLINFNNMFTIPGKIMEAYSVALAEPSEDEKEEQHSGEDQPVV